MCNKFKFISGLLCLLFSLNSLSGQTTPEILVYDFQTKSMDTIKSFSYNVNTVNAKTDNYQGLKQTIDLSLDVPQDNLVEKTQFTYQTPVDELFENIAYPLSTSVKLVLPNRDDRHQCTGVMVSENFVLSSAHCTIDTYNNDLLIDDIDAIIGYDESLNASENMRARVKRVYFIKDWNIGNGEDLALYELEHPVGLFSGWMSIGFEENLDNLEGKVMHKMSYPAYNTPLNKNDFDGQELHVSYGVVDYVVPEYIGVKNHLVGAGGESGSPIFTTNNEDEYTAHGVLTWAGFHNHSRFNAPTYFAYENIISNNSVVAEAVLPVELVSFEASTDNQDVLLSWKAEKELNLEGYEVERSLDGETFEYIGFVAANNTYQAQEYQFSDSDNQVGVVYYRLRSLDLDGSEEYSEVRSVKLNNGSRNPLATVEVYPNPASDYVKVNTNNADQLNQTLSIYNAAGQIMTTTSFSDNTLVDVQNFKSGTYHVVVGTDTQKETHTLLIQH